ncbi:MAG TPA: hypothetical protein PLU53_10585 [Bacteroidia bacterium]|nr:hypothetical protein [Bacteroidia bacterium]
MKSPRYLFLEIAGLILFLLLVTGFLEWKYASYQTQADILMENFQKKKTNAEILWLGNSHTIPLIAQLDSLNAKPGSVSFAYGGMDLFWSTVLLEKYMDQIPGLKTICIGADEELLGYNQTRFKLEYINRALYRYTDTLDDDSPFNRLLARSNFFRTNRDISYLVNQRNQPSDLKPMLHGFFTPGSMDQQCRERAKENTLTRFSTELIPENIALLKQIIEKAKAAGKNVILFSTPKSSCYLHYRDSTSIGVSKNAFREFISQHPVVFLNGNTNPYPDSLFRDPDHLNLMGATVFLDNLNLFVREKTGMGLFRE